MPPLAAQNIHQPRPDISRQLSALLNERILVLDGAMGTMIQGYNFSEEDYRGNRFKDYEYPLKGKNDLLSITQPKAIKEIHESFLQAGADIIEIGMPFSDPMADGPSIQASSLRAINSGHKMEKTFEMIESFRKDNSHTPIILMGYFNPIYNYGVNSFIKKIIDIEVDGVIVVDLPPEEDNELCDALEIADLSFIRLVTPTTNADRLNKILQKTSRILK